MKSRRVVILAFDGIQSLDLIGPAEVFAAAGRLSSPGYAVEVVTPAGGPVALSNGLALTASAPAAEAAGRIDTLLVAGGDGARAAASDPVVGAWVREAAGRSRRVASVCTGAFVLAAAGLLDGRRATTHWAWCDALAQSHPAIDVEADPIFVRDGKYATSAGVTAGMDLTLALVEEDLGRDVALEVARWLVLFLKRPGGQSQFSAGLAGQMADREPLRDLQAWLPDHLGEDLSVAALAARAFMSPRNFARAFRRETGSTPAAYVEALRVERARSMLEEGSAGLDTIAAACGFGTVETLRRAFHRRVRVGPAAYRSRFRGPAAAVVTDAA
jgi:transcriptional regulator GlxA family with amidase domain